MPTACVLVGVSDFKCSWYPGRGCGGCRIDASYGVASRLTTSYESPAPVKINFHLRRLSLGDKLASRQVMFQLCLSPQRPTASRTAQRLGQGVGTADAEEKCHPPNHTNPLVIPAPSFNEHRVCLPRGFLVAGTVTHTQLIKSYKAAAVAAVSTLFWLFIRSAKTHGIMLKMTAQFLTSQPEPHVVRQTFPWKLPQYHVTVSPSHWFPSFSYVFSGCQFKFNQAPWVPTTVSAMEGRPSSQL